MAKAKSKRRQGKGSILLIAALLMTSAGIRVFYSASEVLAKEGVNAFSLPVVQPVNTSPETQTRTEMSTLLEALQERESQIADRERKMQVREKAMQVAKAEIERRLVALKDAEKKLASTLARANSATEDDVARLTSVYENMKTKDAAALFEAMEPEFAAGFLGRMRPEAAAAIMAGLPPNIAYTISVLLAGRNANAPKT